MNEWYYSSAGYVLFAISTAHIDVGDVLVYKALAVAALIGIAIIHLIHGVTRRALSLWIIAAAYLLYGATYGAFLYRTYVS